QVQRSATRSRGPSVSTRATRRSRASRGSSSSSAAVADTYSVGDSTTAVSSLQPRVTRSAVGLWHRYRLRSLECLLPELLGLCARRGPIATGRRSGCGWVLLQQPQRIDELSQHVGFGRDALDPLPRIGVGGSR